MLVLCYGMTKSHPLHSKALMGIAQEFEEISCALDERRIRLWCAARALSYNRAYSRGGVMLVHQATGVSRRRIYAGISELIKEEDLPVNRVRRPGGGRKKTIDKYPDILDALEALVEPDSSGDPQSALRWTCKSTYKLADELSAQGYQVCYHQVGSLLKDLDYSLQSNKKRKEGASHPDRDAQFVHINEAVKAFHAKGQPALSVDTKKKENIGEYKNQGREWRPTKHPRDVNVYDFIDKDLGKVVPYGLYDSQYNQGWVSIGINNDTAQFAVHAIRTWYHQVGNVLYPDMAALLITADCGGSNGYRVRLWKRELQQLANELNIAITVCHYPPGTSKWNKIEHRMFSFISQNWRGKPLIDRQTVLELIGHTKTKKGLEIIAVLDENVYQKGIKVSDEDMEALHIEKHDFHGEWNYTIKPQIDA